MADFKNEFSWSFSRHGVFEECPRKYWLNHYAFWNGWRNDCPPRTRELYIQKNLATRPMWLGTVVHDAAEYALKTFRSSRFVGADELVSKTLDRAEMDWSNSRNERYRANPKKFPGFQEHYYDAEESEPIESTFVEIERQVRTLYENKIFKRILQVPERIQQLEDLNELILDGIKVWVKLDVLMEDGRGGLVIVDWKTGRSHQTETVQTQLGVYGLYAKRELGVSAIKTMHVNLRSNEFSTFDIDDAQLERSEAFVRDSAKAMLQKLDSPDENRGTEAHFEKLPEGSSSCSRCRFRGDCER